VKHITTGNYECVALPTELRWQTHQNLGSEDPSWRVVFR